ncbi:hypothetical protein D9M69_481040 [compost metagenome]
MQAVATDKLLFTNEIFVIRHDIGIKHAMAIEVLDIVIEIPVSRPAMCFECRYRFFLLFGRTKHQFLLFNLALSH